MPTRPAAAIAASALVFLAACATAPEDSEKSAVQQFLRMYNEIGQRIHAVNSEAEWRAVTDVNPQHTGERIGASAAYSAFRGSRYVIESARKYLELRQSLSDLEFRQLDKILLNAAESPGTVPEVVQARIRAEARLAAALDGFSFCLDGAVQPCARKTTPNQIDEVLLKSTDLKERRLYWETSKQSGAALKSGLAEVRDLRNRVARQLGYSSYFHLQVADYGMTVDEMMKLMDKTVTDVQPLYDLLHHYARRRLAARYHADAPPRLPAHWLPNRWGQAWPGLVPAADFDPLLRQKSPRWIVEQAERFYVSLGMQPLPKSFWEKSDLYEIPAGSPRRKNTHASAWHMDRAEDVRSLMSVVPNFYWFETTHHELGHVYYYINYTNPKVPFVLREGLNRAFHEAIGDLIGAAARQPRYLKQIGLMPQDREIDRMQLLLAEALNSSVVFLPWSAGVMTHYENELYEKNLPADSMNRRWWEMVAQYQRIEPPAPRGEQYCDGCTKTHIIDDAAQYYDYAMASLIRYQLHDHIARRILKQDPRDCNYYGNKEVGRWLQEILSLGATRDWRQVIREKTGEELSSRAMVDYFRPLDQYVAGLNQQPVDTGR